MGTLIAREHAAAHRCFPVEAAEDVGTLRRGVRALAAQAHSLREGEAELVAVELATNILRHTPGGYVLARPVGEGIELLAVDRGRGLPEPALAGLAVPAATLPVWDAGRGGLGVGLAAVRRRATVFDYHSAIDGTVILARLGVESSTATADWSWGGINVPLGGDGPSGDTWAVTADGARLAAVLFDGLGHGPNAAHAAHTGIAEFDRENLLDQARSHGPGPASAAFADRTHRVLRSTRGAAVGLCLIDSDAAAAVFTSVGNVSARIHAGASSTRLLEQPGTLGSELAAPKPRPTRYPWSAGATLLLASDGIDTRWDLSARPRLMSRHPTVIAAVLYRDHTRGRDDAAILVVKHRPAQSPTREHSDA